MLVLSRRAMEGVMVGEIIEIVVREIHGNNVRLGIKAPHPITVWRAELCPQEASGNSQADRPKVSPTLSALISALGETSEALLDQFCERRKTWRMPEAIQTVCFCDGPDRRCRKYPGNGLTGCQLSLRLARHWS